MKIFLLISYSSIGDKRKYLKFRVKCKIIAGRLTKIESAMSLEPGSGAVATSTASSVRSSVEPYN